MDEIWDDTHGSSSVELKKKRKLQGEQLGIPSSKHKFGDKFYGDAINSPISHFREFKGGVHAHQDESKTERISDSFEECESVKDSNSFDEEFDTGTMALDAKNRNAHEIGASNLDWPHVSCVESYMSNHRLYSSVAIQNRVQSSYVGNETNLAIFEGNSKLERELPSSEDQLNEHGMDYHDFITSEEIGGKEQINELLDDDTMLYSNGVISNSYVLSSGRWNVTPDARLSARKPTIDQEFEQYFSTLML